MGATSTCEPAVTDSHRVNYGIGVSSVVWLKVSAPRARRRRRPVSNRRILTSRALEYAAQHSTTRYQGQNRDE